MNIHAETTKENKNHLVVSKMSQKHSGAETTFQFADNRPEAITQRKLQKMGTNSFQAKQASQLKAIANNHSENPIQKQGLEEEELLQGKFNTIQKQGSEEEELLQGKFEPIQKKGIEEEELLQGKFESVQKKENNTGLPDNLKSGIENLSGHSLDDVKVHYNSDKPAQLNAHAYAQGTDIHLASGQEKHLPHEAWHVVQQKQGRVKPTLQMKGGVNVNDEEGLEKEADMMGERKSEVSLVVQRMLIQLGSDIAENINVKHLRESNPIEFRDGNLNSLVQGEVLHLLAHSGGNSFGGMNASKLFSYLVTKGLSLNVGAIQLHGCESSEFATMLEYFLNMNSPDLNWKKPKDKPIKVKGIPGYSVISTSGRNFSIGGSKGNDKIWRKIGKSVNVNPSNEQF